MTASTSKELLQKIFEYDDYRTFLKDYFSAKKRENPNFSQRYFTAKVGFKAHNFCTFVIAGKRNLSLDSIRLLVRGIGLRGRAAMFFENLVFLNQAQTIEDKELYFQKLKKTGKSTEFYQLNKEQFFFYEKWYYPVVRELVVFSNWFGNYERLAKMVRPAISPAEAKETVEQLVTTGMVVRSDDGRRYQVANGLVTSEKVPIYIKKKARRDVLMLGIDAVESINPAEKYAAYSTVAMSKETYEEARGMLDEVRERILARAAGDTDPNEVYEVVFQVFPVSRMNPAPEGGRHE